MSRKHAPDGPEQADDRYAKESPEQRRKREEFEHYCEENRRERDQTRRVFFTLFKMWTICDDKRCIRNKACSGDTDECVMKRWRRTISDEVRTWLARTCHHVGAGLSVPEAMDKAKADIEAANAMLARYEAQRAARRVPDENEDEAAPASPGPRIWSP